MRTTLALAFCFLISGAIQVSAIAQDVSTLREIGWFAADSTAASGYWNADDLDSVSVAMRPFSVVEWSLPGRVTNETAVNAGPEGRWRDTIAVRASCPAGYTLRVCTGSTQHDMWLAATFDGPFGMSMKRCPFQTYPTAVQPEGAQYVMVQCVETSGAKQADAGPQSVTDWAQVDGAQLTYHALHAGVVRTLPMPPEIRYVDLLGRPTHRGEWMRALNDSTYLVVR